MGYHAHPGVFTADNYPSLQTVMGTHQHSHDYFFVFNLRSGVTREGLGKEYTSQVSFVLLLKRTTTPQVQSHIYSKGRRVHYATNGRRPKYEANVCTCIARSAWVHKRVIVRIILSHIFPVNSATTL